MTTRRLIAGICAALMLTSTLVGCGLWGSEQPVTIKLLSAGVTEVVVDTTTDADSGSLVVNVAGYQDEEGIARSWSAAAWSAASVATMQAAADPRSLEASFAVSGGAPGPSAGALMSVGVRTDLVGGSLPSDASVIGNVLPNGGIGQVGGVPTMIRTAASQGIKRVLIPAGQRLSFDNPSRRNVDVIALGESLGVDVTEVDSTTQALEVLVGEAEPPADAPVSPIDPEMDRVLAANATEILERIRNAVIAPAPMPVLNAERNATADLFARNENFASQALIADRSMEAFTLAGAAEQALQMWNERAAAVSDAQSLGVQQTAARLDKQGTDAADRILRGTALYASTPVEFQEQLAGLPNALSWGLDALLATRMATRLLVTPSGRTAEGLGQVAADLAEARYDAEVNQGVSVKALMATGSRPIEELSKSVAFLDAYADFLARTADANTSYVRGLGALAPVLTPEEKILEAEVQANWDALKDGTTQPLILTKAAQAISRFIDSSTAVAMLGIAEASWGNTTAQVGANERQALRHQSELATETVANQVRNLAAANLDSSYLRWGNIWGEQLARTEGTGKLNTQLRLEGLAFQWYSNVQAYLLRALNRSS